MRGFWRRGGRGDAGNALANLIFADDGAARGGGGVHLSGSSGGGARVHINGILCTTKGLAGNIALA